MNAVQEWLNIHTSWLLIVDNADDLVMVDEFLPTSANGHILLTTRARYTESLARAIEVATLEEEQGILLLLRRAGLLIFDAPLDQASSDEITMARELVKELDGLPLALDQAGAYIKETGVSLADYIQLYRHHRVSLLKRRGRMTVDHPQSVATTWSLTFAKIEQANPAAGEILYLCAFLHPDAIPEELFSNSAEQLGPILFSIAADPLAFNETIAMLLNYSLIQRNAAESTLSLHRLVQAVLRDTIDKQKNRQWAERAIRAVNQIFPIAMVETWALCQRYLPQAMACAELVEQYNLSFPEAARLLDQAAIYGQARALYSEAEALFNKALSIREDILGSHHSDTAQSLNHLALLYQNQGRYQEAEPLYLRALAIFEEIGSRIDTATSLNNLALLYQNQGKYQEAEPLYQQALIIFEEIGSRIDTATSLNNLANLYQNLGRYQEAEPLLKRALTIREDVLGERHPDTAISLNNLANLHHYQGKYQEAIPLYRQALTVFQQVLGDEHPYTIIISKNYKELLRQVALNTEKTQLKKEGQ